ncbi:sensor histidine kinase [Pedobacter africanus]|uniref:histidine kinase n=1 Tax=Pedobacter africanus TaxID=151894 RepID=A0A1W2CS62_9SPHI|nr:HAMP domain-containing sensor histidine kinase [Pedobacter africanus]SMC87732.1 Signal transduction histidine kinase [Pedobacter africanus]
MSNNSKQIGELTEINEALENYFSNTIIPQLFVDANLILRKYTPPAMKQFKLREEFIGKPLVGIEENFRYPSIIGNIQTVIATGEILEKEIQTTDLSWYQMNILPYMVRKENKTNGVIITFVDITARIRDLKEQEKLIAEHELLLDTIAHDIKNPILGLALTIQMLKRLPEKDIQMFPALLGNVENSLDSIQRVIHDLVDSRWKNQRVHPTEELLDIGNILEDVRLSLAAQIQESGARISQHIECPEIKFVRRKLRSIIYNLLNNAIKYTAEGQCPEVEIRCRKENDYFVISVSDKGIGMTPHERQSIFEKFQRVKLNCEGSGVGLYLVHTMVSAAGGRIELESEPGKGSVFSVCLKDSSHT